MTLDPLLDASPVIRFHVVTALIAAIAGLIVFMRQKGTVRHRVLGRVYAGAMMMTALSSFFIHELKVVGAFSPIHLLSILVTISIPMAILAVRRGDVIAHRKAMIGTYLGGIVVAGVLAFLPGRIMARMTWEAGPKTEVVSGWSASVASLALAVTVVLAIGFWIPKDADRDRPSPRLR